MTHNEMIGESRQLALDNQLWKIVERRLRERVFPRREFHGFLRSCQDQGVRFNATGLSVVAGIRVNRDEQVRVGAV